MPSSPSITVPMGFAGLDARLSDYSFARSVVVPLPYDSTTTYRTGTRDGPAAILAASHALELLDEELLAEPSAVGIATLDPLEVDARGPEHMIRAIRDYCLKPVQDGKFVVALGGEHSVTIGCVEAQLAGQGDGLHVLQIDAHADMRESYQLTPFSHACVMRRLQEKCPVVGVGIRSFCKEEFEFMREQKIEPFSMQLIRENANWADRVVDRLGERVYITIDLDGFDPSCCPGVGTPEPGGLIWPEVLALLRKVFARRQVVGADVVECLPLPGQQVTEFLAARLVYKLIGYRFRGELKP